MKKTEFRRIYNPKNLFFKKWTINLCTFEKKNNINKKKMDFSGSL